MKQGAKELGDYNYKRDVDLEMSFTPPSTVVSSLSGEQKIRAEPVDYDAERGGRDTLECKHR